MGTVAPVFFPHNRSFQMEKYLKAYGAFLVMGLITAVVVRPMVKNVPLVNQI